MYNHKNPNIILFFNDHVSFSGRLARFIGAGRLHDDPEADEAVRHHISRLQQPVGIQGDREERTRVDRQLPPQQPGIRRHHCGGGWLLQAVCRPSAAGQ